MKRFAVIFAFSLLFISGFSQEAVVLKSDEPENYYSGTVWGPEMRHYSYYFVRYAMATPIGNSVYEMPVSSGNWAVGLSYKLKLVSIWDIGVDLAYENEFHKLNNLPETRNFVPEVITFDKVRTYQNNITGAFYSRFYFSKMRDHDFGWYFDAGAFLGYVAGYGYVKKNNTELERVKLRSKQDDEFNNHSYGLFARFGWNQFALYARYNFADVYKNNSIELTPFSIGLQMNLVMF